MAWALRQENMEAGGPPVALLRLREDLLAGFGRQARSERGALETLILGLADVSGPGAERAAEALKRGFKPWNKLLDAPPELLAAALRPVEPNLGRALSRAERLSGAMRRLAARSGGLSLDFLARMTAEAAWAWLEDALGLSPALIAGVLSAAPIRHRVAHPSPPAMRALTRLHLGLPGADATQAGRMFAEAAPPAWTGADLAELTALLTALGEGLCHVEKPDCEACPVARTCPSSTVEAAHALQTVRVARPMAYLRRRIARMEGDDRATPQTGLKLGGAPFSEAVFPNGLSHGVHQAAATSPLQGATPLILAVAAATALERRERDGRAREGPAGFLRARAKPAPPPAMASVRVLVVQEADAVAEHGEIYPPGLSAFGVDPSTTAFVTVGSGAEVLRVVEEALKLRAAPVLVAELRRGEGLVDLAVSRRLNLAARRAGAILFLITPDLANTSAALTRWRIGAVPSRASRRRLGPPAFTLDLVRNRLGPLGAWTVEWDIHERRFRTHYSGLTQPAFPAPHLPPPVDGPAVVASEIGASAIRASAIGGRAAA